MRWHAAETAKHLHPQERGLSPFRPSRTGVVPVSARTSPPPPSNPPVAGASTLYSEQNVSERLGGNLHPDNADHVVTVVYEGGRWFYDSNTALIEFTPVATDLLIAEVDFSAYTVISLEGLSERYAGIEAGYTSGDLEFTANRWNGRENFGEFGISGGSFVR